MVNIPTTERQYQDPVVKQSGMAQLGKVLEGGADTFKKIVDDHETNQNKIRMSANMMDARLKLNALEDQWRKDNQADPKNPKALESLSAGRMKILSSYRDSIDSRFRKDWDIASNDLNYKYKLDNQQWHLKQGVINARQDAANLSEKMADNSYQLGVNGNIHEAIDMIERSANDMNSYLQSEVGKEDAEKIVHNFKRDGIKSFMASYVDNHPDEALELLNGSADNYFMVDRLGPDLSRAFKNQASTTIKRQEEDIKAYKKEMLEGSIQDFINNPSAVGIEKSINMGASKHQIKEMQKALEYFDGTSDTKGITKLLVEEKYNDIKNSTGFDDVVGFRDILRNNFANNKLSEDVYKDYMNKTAKQIIRNTDKVEGTGWYEWYDGGESFATGINVLNEQLPFSSDLEKAYAYETMFSELSKNGIDPKSREDKDIEKSKAISLQIKKNIMEKRDAELVGKDVNSVLLGTDLIGFKPPEHVRISNDKHYVPIRDKVDGQVYKLFNDGTREPYYPPKK